jgi:hypothetical protein
MGMMCGCRTGSRNLEKGIGFSVVWNDDVVHFGCHRTIKDLCGNSLFYYIQGITEEIVIPICLFRRYVHVNLEYFILQQYLPTLAAPELYTTCTSAGREYFKREEYNR